LIKKEIGEPGLAPRSQGMTSGEGRKEARRERSEKQRWFEKGGGERLPKKRNKKTRIIFLYEEEKNNNL